MKNNEKQKQTIVRSDANSCGSLRRKAKKNYSSKIPVQKFGPKSGQKPGPKSGPKSLQTLSDQKSGPKSGQKSDQKSS